MHIDQGGQHRLCRPSYVCPYYINHLMYFPDVPDSKTFDVTLMTTLLRNLTTMTPPLCGFDRLPSAMETTAASDLARIKYYRNYLAHLTACKIDVTFFNTAYDDITRVCTFQFFLR